jgi:hypothetical protein
VIHLDHLRYVPAMMPQILRLLPKRCDVVGGGGGTVNNEDRRLTNVSAAVGAIGPGVNPFGGRSLTTLLTGLLGVGIRGCRGDGRVERSFDIEGPSLCSLARRGSAVWNENYVVVNRVISSDPVVSV